PMALYCSRSFSKPMSMRAGPADANHRMPAARTPSASPHRKSGDVRPQRGQSVRCRAVRSALVATGTLALLAGLAAAGAGCSRHAEQPAPTVAGPQLVVRTVAAPDAHYSPDEYVQLVATRVHVSRRQRSAFWQAVGSYFVDRSTSAILT